MNHRSDERQWFAWNCYCAFYEQRLFIAIPQCSEWAIVTLDTMESCVIQILHKISCVSFNFPVILFSWPVSCGWEMACNFSSSSLQTGAINGRRKREGKLHKGHLMLRYAREGIAYIKDEIWDYKTEHVPWAWPLHLSTADAYTIPSSVFFQEFHVAFIREEIYYFPLSSARMKNIQITYGTHQVALVSVQKKTSRTKILCRTKESNKKRWKWKLKEGRTEKNQPIRKTPGEK